ncbi:hypothetical protein [Paenibacillus pedocola]|uniref:hypothetical protein n=1 Tax=Paenibacillus pedocola TaxID=3242193 RepID=UPI0028779457|nr:hypothetical protein [Paenibacillus typhae]
MSSFMKDVITEVLQRNRTAAPAGAAASAPSCAVSSREKCPHTCAQPGNCSKPKLPVQRTNYQKEQAARRLAVLSGHPSPAQAPAGRQPDSLAAARVVQPANQPAADAAPGREMAGQYLSPLLLRTLSPLEQKDNSPGGTLPHRGSPRSRKIRMPRSASRQQAEWRSGCSPESAMTSVRCLAAPAGITAQPG